MTGHRIQVDPHYPFSFSGLIACAQPNTYDTSIYGVNTFIGAYYLCALRYFICILFVFYLLFYLLFYFIKRLLIFFFFQNRILTQKNFFRIPFNINFLKCRATEEMAKLQGDAVSIHISMYLLLYYINRAIFDFLSC